MVQAEFIGGAGKALSSWLSGVEGREFVCGGEASECMVLRRDLYSDSGVPVVFSFLGVVLAVPGMLGGGRSAKSRLSWVISPFALGLAARLCGGRLVGYVSL